MEQRLLKACTERLRDELLPRIQIVGAYSPGPFRSEILLERIGTEEPRMRLVIDLAPKRATCYLARARPAPTESDSFHRQMIGQWIVDLAVDDRMPLLRLVLSMPGTDQPQGSLVFEWLGGNPDALIIEAGSGRIVAGLRSPTGAHARRRAREAVYQPPPAPRNPWYEEASTEQIGDAVAREPNRPPIEAIQRGLAGLPACFAYQATRRGESDPAAIAGTLRELSAAPFAPTLYRTRGEVERLPTAFVSPVPLESLEPFRSKRTDPLFGLLKDAHETMLRVGEEEEIRELYLRTLGSEERRLMRLHQHLEREKEDAAEAGRLRRAAESLLVHLSQIPRGASSHSCPDPADPNETLQIDLDPALTVPENADALFRRARRLERGEPLRRKRLAAIEEAVANLSILRERSRKTGAALAQKGGGWLKEALGRLSSRRVLDRWEERISAFGSSANTTARPRAPGSKPRASKRRQVPGFHPRVYTTSDGWKVVVGRSNAENDHVTHSVAQPDDYWFHAQGCPGSHVVLRREGRKDNPSARTIEEVAAIAAFFSKARTSRKAPVAYTLKKYVRKPRKAPPGLALVEREKTVMVEPKAPESSQNGGWEEEDS